MGQVVDLTRAEVRWRRVASTQNLRNGYQLVSIPAHGLNVLNISFKSPKISFYVCYLSHRQYFFDSDTVLLVRMYSILVLSFSLQWSLSCEFCTKSNKNGMTRAVYRPWAVYGWWSFGRYTCVSTLNWKVCTILAARWKLIIFTELEVWFLTANT